LRLRKSARTGASIYEISRKDGPAIYRQSKIHPNSTYSPNAGETEQRLYVLKAWRQSPFYSDRERAALAWAEAATSPPKS